MGVKKPAIEVETNNGSLHINIQGYRNHSPIGLLILGGIHQLSNVLITLPTLLNPNGAPNKVC